MSIEQDAEKAAGLLACYNAPRKRWDGTVSGGMLESINSPHKDHVFTAKAGWAGDYVEWDYAEFYCFTCQAKCRISAYELTEAGIRWG